MEKLNTLWNYTLLTLSNGDAITLGQAFSALLFFALALTLGRYLTRLLSRQLRRSQVDPNAIQTIVRLFNENGIAIAFPQRDIHLDASKPLEIHLQNGQPA